MTRKQIDKNVETIRRAVARERGANGYRGTYTVQRPTGLSDAMLPLIWGRLPMGCAVQPGETPHTLTVTVRGETS